MTKVMLRSLVVGTLLVCCSVVRAQDENLANAEYGSIDEILSQRLTKVFVYGGDLRSRDLIVKELRKGAPSLEIVERKEDALFILGFEVQDQVTGASIYLGSVSTNRTYYGVLLAIRPVVGSDGGTRARILWHTEKRQAFSGGFTFSRHPAINAAREFVKALKKVQKTSAQRTSEPTDLRASAGSTGTKESPDDSALTVRPRTIETQPELVPTPTDPVSANNLLVGTWKVVVELPNNQSKEFLMTIRQAGGKLMGTLRSSDGITAIEQIESVGDSFTITAAQVDSKDVISLKMVGSIAGNSLTGSLSINQGKMAATIPFMGSRL